ncbi:MAG: hypothetical protein RL662_2350 [Bacteroidota bacterium]|jgi:hypothetical protein
MTKITKTLIIFFLYYAYNICSAYAQDNDRYFSVNKSTLMGIGNSNIYDTYLSPLKYTGTSLRLMNERMKKTSWFNNQFTNQRLIDVEMAFVDSPAGNSRQYSVLGNYNWGGHYNLIKTDRFRFSIGSLWSITGGVVYNQRNSNNPASARAYSNIHLSAIAFYNWKSITFRGQIDTPIAGVLFSPKYGQTYYEISLDNSIKIFNIASLHNQRGLKSYFTADIPISKISLRLGYLGTFYQTKIHYLHTHNYASSFVIGLVSESINLSGNKIKKSSIIDSSYY